MYHQLRQEKCLKPFGRLELQDALKRDLPDGSSPRSRRACSHPEFSARSSLPGPGRAAARRGSQRSPLDTGRCAAAPRERSPHPALRFPFQGSGSRLPTSVGRVGWRMDPQLWPPAPLPQPPRLNSAAPCPGNGSLRRAHGQGGIGPWPWLCPRAVEDLRARAWRPRGPCVGPGGAEGRRRGSAPHGRYRNRPPGRGESRRAPDEAGGRLFLSFLSLSAPPNAFPRSGRRGEAGRARAEVRREPGQPLSSIPLPEGEATPRTCRGGTEPGGLCRSHQVCRSPHPHLVPSAALGAFRLFEEKGSRGAAGDGLCHFCLLFHYFCLALRLAVTRRRVEAQGRAALPGESPLPSGPAVLLHPVPPQRIPAHPRPAQPSSARRGLCSSLQAEEPATIGGLQ